MKNIIFLLLSVFLFLTGCGEKLEQLTTPPATDNAASLDSEANTPKEQEKTQPETEAPQEELAATPSKENSQFNKAPDQDSKNNSSNGTSSVTTQKKDTNPTSEAPDKPVPAKALEDKPTTPPAPVLKPASAPPPPPVKETVVEEKKTETVQLSIRGDKERGVILPPSEVKFEAGDTVLKVLARSLKEKKIPMEYRGSGGAAYVEGIANLYEFDRGPTSGWMFRVNGVFGSQSAGFVKLQPGDQVEWLYTLDLGKDIGAKP